MAELSKVARTDQLPVGARKLCTIEDRRIAIFNLGGTLYAIDNHCTHRDGPVGAGELNDVVITCPWHGWRFNVTSGRCLEDGANLRCYPVHVEGSDVLVDVTPTDGSDSDDGIYCYLVRYGALGHVGRVGSINRIPCRRGDTETSSRCVPRRPIRSRRRTRIAPPSEPGQSGSPTHNASSRLLGVSWRRAEHQSSRRTSIQHPS